MWEDTFMSYYKASHIDMTDVLKQQAFLKAVIDQELVAQLQERITDQYWAIIGNHKLNFNYFIQIAFSIIFYMQFNMQIIDNCNCIHLLHKNNSIFVWTWWVVIGSP